MTDSRAVRLARSLASPTGVLIVLPALVLAVGIVVFALGRGATNDASESMARRQLAAQAADVQHDVAFALDQADPLFASLRALADPATPMADVAIRMRDLVIGRPGVANVSIAFPSGVMRGTYLDNKTGELAVQESQVGAHGTDRTDFHVTAGAAVAVGHETTTYDPRTRPHYTLAQSAHARVWMPARTFFTSHKTGLTVTEPIYDAAGALTAVTTVDFDVAELSSFIALSPLEGARTVMFTADGAVLAFPSVPLPAIASTENRLLKHGDFHDPALEALFATAHFESRGDPIEFYELDTADGSYLASVAPVGGKRAGIAAPLDWYLATLVPTRTLLGPTKRFETESFAASGGALAIAVAVALMFAWNLGRMRRQVAAARVQAQSAEARARELGSYRLVSRLGAGGMGEVWRAEHRLLARQAAIKLMRPEALVDPLIAPRVRERFRREAQTLAAMRSRHTIELHDYGVTDDGTFYYVMELLDGMDLDTLVRDHGAQPAARVIELLAQACLSLAEAHEANLLHRDIKPANLFISRAADEVDILKVLDFGIVRAIGEAPSETSGLYALPVAPMPPAASISTGQLTQIGAMVGTPGFIPPEQARGLPIDGRSDLYALGCVAWWLLTRSEVFERTDDRTMLNQHLTEAVPSLAPRVDGWLPSALEELIVSCLAKHPDDRPADARALARALNAIEIPPEHAWTEELAQTWWFAHVPQPAAFETAATADDRVLVTVAGAQPAAGAPTPAGTVTVAG